MMVRIDEILPERDTLGKHLYHLSEQTVCTPIGAKTVKLVRVAPKTPDGKREHKYTRSLASLQVTHIHSQFVGKIYCKEASI